MILNDQPQNEAVLSNVGEIGEFRIRNSAKAFSILSSGLYANKIRAIIRELSCNAVDSHTAAGKADTPFDVHLPTQLEPWFSIRDYGTGLSHDQVTQIYTTYFESTKTTSNEFIGALGLGSKSPFSYTDNFTVTAVQNGHKGIYSAFINGQGVPSIALMMEEETTDPNGVEVKFSVNDRWDFSKFREEARSVYTYFKLRPVVNDDFTFKDLKYETENIIPGVSTFEANSGYTRTVAIMGNIAYPIDIPNPQENLGELAGLMRCGIEMRFNIGELDFQASREGLSYIPSTIDAIKAKLSALVAQLSISVAEEADAIENKWERAQWLIKKHNHPLWSSAVVKYITDTKFELVDARNTSYLRTKEFKFPVKELANDYNISIVAFTKSSGSVICSNYKPYNEHVKNGATVDIIPTWAINVRENVFFVTNDTKIGAAERAKNHWRKQQPKTTNGYREHTVYVLSAADATKAMDTKGFFETLGNPPTDAIMAASTLIAKERKASSGGVAKDVTILKLEERGFGGYYREKEMVWRDAGKADQYDATKTYYYLPLKGFEVISTGVQIDNVKTFYTNIRASGIPGTENISVYGVRKTDHEWVSKQKNWVNIQTHIKKELSKCEAELVNHFAINELDLSSVFRYNTSIVEKVTDANSDYVKFVTQSKGVVKNGSVSRHSFEKLYRDYSSDKVLKFDDAVANLRAQRSEIMEKYPLLGSISSHDVDPGAVAQYINLIDKEVK